MALKSANQPIRWKERIGVMALGHTFKQGEEFFFDYTLYPFVIVTMGMLWGGLVMTVLSATICYLYILFYDWSKQDWLGLELLKEARDGEQMESWLGRKAQAIARKGDVAAFFAFSVYTDPFVTTAYLRKGSGFYNGMTRRDWKIFFASVAVANLAWIGVVSGAIEAIRWVFKFFS